MKKFLKLILWLLILILIAGGVLYGLDYFNVYHFQVGSFKISDVNKLWNQNSGLKKLDIDPNAANQTTSQQTYQNGSQMMGESQSQANLVASSLNGVMIAQERAQLPVLAVMIENSPQARWQSGLNKADIVYETLAEGGITRFMAIFQSQDADVVGPVRSARTYFAEVVREYNAWFSHVGGSVDGIKFIKQYALHDLDAFFVDKPYWRDPTRLKTRGLEHSMYTNTFDLRKNIQGFAELNNFDGWSFKDEVTQKSDSDKKQTQNITIKFSFPGFDALWKYDPEQNNYVRYTGGATHKDAQNGQQLLAKNIIVQYVKMTPILNQQKGDDSALKLDLTGSGEGMLFQDGKAIAITWKKDKSGDHTQYYYADGVDKGQKIQLNRGVIWVELAEKGKVSL